LSLECDLDIVGEADDAVQGISLTQALTPDVVLIDAETPDLDAAHTVRALAEKDGRSGIVVLSQHAAAIADGLSGVAVMVVGKNEGPAAVVRAIRSAARRGRPAC
jgi:DNA-binding NarL/FixJ family response regulator